MSGTSNGHKLIIESQLATLNKWEKIRDLPLTKSKE